eukprot:COSAG06_NODE_244_length_19215_cov_20.256853_5_plen_277_part_00
MYPLREPAAGRHMYAAYYGPGTESAIATPSTLPCIKRTCTRLFIHHIKALQISQLPKDEVEKLPEQHAAKTYRKQISVLWASVELGDATKRLKHGPHDTQCFNSLSTGMLAPWGLVCLAFFGIPSHLLIFQPAPNLGTRSRKSGESPTGPSLPPPRPTRLLRARDRGTAAIFFVGSGRRGSPDRAARARARARSRHRAARIIPTFSATAFQRRRPGPEEPQHVYYRGRVRRKGSTRSSCAQEGCKLGPLCALVPCSISAALPRCRCLPVPVPAYMY